MARTKIDPSLFKTQTVFTTGTTFTTTSSTSFVDTVVSGTITPLSSNHRVKITISTSIRNTAARPHWGVGRNGTNISEQGEKDGTAEMPLCFSWIDSPATTSATVYTLQVKMEGVGSMDVNINNLTWSIILEEIA